MRHVNSRLLCGCYLTFVGQMQVYAECRPEITFCPLHRHADKLLDVCKLLVACGAYDFKEKVLDRAQDIIAMAEAKPEEEPTNVKQ